jgi:hypothetical protein
MTRITRNSPVVIKKNSGELITGKISLIKADTLFFEHTYLRVTDIDSLSFFYPSAFPGPGSIPGPSPYQKNRPMYIFGSPDYQLICPPDSVYRSQLNYNSYYKSKLRQAKNVWLEKKNPLIHKNFLKLNVAKIFHLELALSYERLLAKNFTWETEVSAIFGVVSFTSEMINYPLFNYSGFSITSYPKFWVNPRTYLAVVLMYRNLGVVGMKSDWPDAMNYGKLQDQFRNDYGLSFRLGVMKCYGRFVIDYYAGFGVKDVWLHQLVYGEYIEFESNTIHWYNQDHSATISDTDRLGLVLNLGIKIGGAF